MGRLARRPTFSFVWVTNLRRIFYSFGLMALTAGHPALAQALHQSPLVVDQGRIDRSAPRGKATPIPRRDAQSARRDDPGSSATFSMEDIRVEGAASLPEAERLAQAYLGQQSDVAALTALATTIADAYKVKDVAYYTAEISDIDQAHRRITVRVREAYVTDLVIVGAVDERWKQRVRRILAPLLQQRPLRRSSYERLLAQASDIPGLKVDAAMEASDLQGGIALHLDLRRKGPDLAVGFHNYGSDLLGADTLEAAARFTGLAMAGDELGFYYSAPANFHRSHYVSTSYGVPIDHAGTTLRITGGVLRTRLFYDLLKGSAVQGGLIVSRPLFQRFGRSLTGSVGVDFINLENALLGYRLTDDRTRASRASIHYMEEAARHRLDVDLGVSLGMGLLGARAITPVSQAKFTKLNLRVDYAQQIASRTLVRLKGIAQISSARLPAAEQIAAGGSDFGRGLSAGLISGDAGWAGSAEIAQQPDIPSLLKGTEFYAFADGADVRYADRGPYPGSSYRVASVGAGARVRIAGRASVDMGAAAVLRSPYAGYPDRWRITLVARLALGD